MRAFAFTIIFSALVLAVLASPSHFKVKEPPTVNGYKQGDKCPASIFLIDCNYCSCNEDGHSADCSSIDCPPRGHDNGRVDSEIPHNDLFGKTGECTPFEVFYDKCNVCHCNPDGKSAGCTDALCPEPKNPRIDGYKQGTKCPAGTTFYDKCNACKCLADGRSAICTLVAC